MIRKAVYTKCLTRPMAFALVASMVLASSALAIKPLVLPVRTVGPLAVESRSLQKDIDRLATASSDSMQLLAQLYATVNGVLTFGDTDHDGFNEVIMAVSFGDADYRILEEQGNNTYVEVFVGPYFDPYAAGDFDKDGNAEVLGQYGNLLLVYESPSSSTHPSTISWQSPPLTNVVGDATVADSDGDGRVEIIHSINTFATARLVIYENAGDNTFCQVYYNLESPQDAGPKLVADLDGDGRTEIALCGTYGYLHVYESPADNMWLPTFFDSTGLDNAYAVTGGVDTDGNGRPELFVSGDSQEIPGQRRTFVYEAVGDNCFTRVAMLPFYDAHRGGLRSCVANLDATGREEFILAVDGELLIYRSVAPGQWTVVIAIADSGLPKVFDANKNGRPELFSVGIGHAAFGSTLVFEHTAVSPTDQPFEFSAAGNRLIAFPNPCRTKAILILAERSRTNSSTIATFDASGRLVSRFAVPTDVDRLSWSPGPMGAGIYFLRLEAATGAPLAQGRITVIR